MEISVRLEDIFSMTRENILMVGDILRQPQKDGVEKKRTLNIFLAIIALIIQEVSILVK